MSRLRRSIKSRKNPEMSFLRFHRCATFAAGVDTSKILDNLRELLHPFKRNKPKQWDPQKTFMRRGKPLPAELAATLEFGSDLQRVIQADIQTPCDVKGTLLCQTVRFPTGGAVLKFS